MIKLDLYKIKKEIESGKSIFDLKLKVVYYARVSTDKHEQANSLENQIKYYDDFIKSNKNWYFCGGYIDEGISGTAVGKRKSFLKMIEDAKDGKFDLIITKEISRFSRNTLDSIKYTQKLLKYGVGVYFQSDGINTLMPEGELRLTIMAAIAQDEVRRISQRVKFGLNQSVKNGKMLGDAPYGYKKKDGILTINESEAKVVKEIFSLYLKGYGIRSISRILADKNIFNTNGRPFTFASIKNIISNPKYKGFYCANKYYSVDFKYGKKQTHNKDEWILYKDESVPKIISEDTWEKANSILSERSNHFKNHLSSYSNRYFFSGKIICGYDKSSFHRGIYNKNEVFKCKNSRNGCKNITIYTKEIESIMSSVFLFLKKNRILLADFFEDYLNARIPEGDIDKLNRKKDKLFELVAEGFISGNEFKEKNDKLNDEISKLSERKTFFDKDSFLNDSFDFKTSKIKITKIIAEKTFDINDEKENQKFKKNPHEHGGNRIASGALLKIYLSLYENTNYLITLHETPISCATSIWVFPLKNLRLKMCFSRSLSFFIASLSDISSIQLSSKLFSSLT